MAVNNFNNSGVVSGCNAKQPQPAFNTTIPSMPSLTPLTIGDWESLAHAIWELQSAVTALGAGGGGGGGGNNTKSKPPKDNKKPGNKNPKQKPTDWKQTKKTTELVKIVNPDDHSQYVIVQRTVSQTFQNPVTKETLTISNSDNPGSSGGGGGVSGIS